MALRLTSTPSALGKKLIHAICPGSKPFETCHCAKMVWGFWRAQMTVPIKSGLAGKKFNKDTYADIFKEADEIWRANGGASSVQAAVVASVSAPTPPSSTPSDVGAEGATPQVAAFQASRGRGNGRGGRGNRGNGRGTRGGGRGSYNNTNNAQNTNQNQNNSNTKPHQRGDKHRDLPADASWACAQHWKKGRQAPYCSDPHVCKWVNKTVPRA